MNIKHILQGLSNTIFVKEEVEKIAKERMDICEGCPKISTAPDDSLKGPLYSTLRPDEHCTECGCNLHLKTRSLDTSCPLNKWLSVSDEHENALVQNAMKDSSS